MKKGIVLLSFAALVFASCKKETKSCAKTMEAIAGTYTLVKVEQGGGGSYSDVTNETLQSCQRDDKYVLNANGVLNYQDAGTACVPDGTDTQTWSIGANGKMNLDIAGSLMLTDVTIVSYDCTTLVGEAVYGNFGGIPLTLRVTFRK